MEAKQFTILVLKIKTAACKSFSYFTSSLITFAYASNIDQYQILALHVKTMTLLSLLFIYCMLIIHKYFVMYNNIV